METTEEKKENTEGYVFSVNWHMKHAESWNKLFEVFRPKKAIEIGSYEGMSAVFTLDAAVFLNELVCIDSWEGGEEHKERDFGEIESRFDSNIALNKKASIVRKMKGDSQDSLLALINEGKKESYDLIYVDGNHTASGTLEDAVLSWKLLAEGGFMIFDDYLWRAFPINHSNMSPKVAIDAFTTIYSNNSIIIPDFPAHQVVIKKYNVHEWAKGYYKENNGRHPLIIG